MTLTAMLIAAVLVAVIWRAVRLLLRVVLLAAVIAGVGWYAHHHHDRHLTVPSITRQLGRHAREIRQLADGRHVTVAIHRH